MTTDLAAPPQTRPPHINPQSLRDYKASWARRKRRLVAYGQWEPTRMVDTNAVRDHITNLRGFGISVPTIERLAGEGKGQMAQLLYGDQKTITMQRAERILAVRFDLDAIPPTKLVDASGTRRRIEALMCNGWSYTHLGATLGVSRQLLTKHHNAKHVTAATARTIRDMYGRLWDQPGPEPRAIGKAKREGFSPPLAWDDDTIDDPNATPDLGEATVRPAGGQGRPIADLVEDIEWLLRHDSAMTTSQLAVRLGYVDKSGIQNALTRHGHRDILDRLKRNAELAA